MAFFRNHSISKLKILYLFAYFLFVLINVWLLWKDGVHIKGPVAFFLADLCNVLLAVTTSRKFLQNFKNTKQNLKVRIRIQHIFLIDRWIWVHVREIQKCHYKYIYLREGFVWEMGDPKNICTWPTTVKYRIIMHIKFLTSHLPQFGLYEIIHHSIKETCFSYDTCIQKKIELKGISYAILEIILSGHRASSICSPRWGVFLISQK